MRVSERQPGDGLPPTRGLPPAAGAAWFLCRRFWRDENGKVAIISIFVIGAIALMIGFVTNLGLTIRERIRLQNAADAAAASTTLWMARAMNGITATNHMMGEATAILAALEGFGGPLLGSGRKVFSEESNRYNRLITRGSELVPLLKGGTFTPALAELDRNFVKVVKRTFTSDEGRHDAGAAIYDGRMMLKFAVFVCFSGKKIGNVVMAMAVATKPVPSFSVPLEGLSSGIHLLMNGALLKCLQEWFALNLIQRAVAGIKETKLPDTIESRLIPALSLHADSVVGLGVAQSVGQGASPMNRAIRSTLDDLAGEHGVESLETAPAWSELVLPVEREPPPPRSSEKEHGPWELPPIVWSGSYESVFVREILDSVRNAGDMFERLLRPIKAILEFWEKAEKAGANVPGWLGPVRTAFNQAIKELDEIQQALAMVPKPDGFPGNPLLDPATPEEFRLPEFHWQIEQRTQWVRATHPYVDDYRSSVIHFLRAVVPISNTATFYVHWTDRFTLAKSFALRSREDRPCHMHVLRGSTATTKGRERWTTDGAAAERLFCVAAVATGKAPAAIMTEVFFRSPSGSRQAVSQSMLYNANGRVVPQGAAGLTQPPTGWDTLNWRPPVVAWEWSDHPPSTAAGNFTDLFRGSKPAAITDRVRLSWRSKLVPVNTGFIERVAPAGMKRFVEWLRRDRRMLVH